MIPIFKPLVYLHSDAEIEECGCGRREWQIELPIAHYWRNYPAPAFETMQEAIEFARGLDLNHPSIIGLG